VTLILRLVRTAAATHWASVHHCKATATTTMTSGRVTHCSKSSASYQVE